VQVKEAQRPMGDVFLHFCIILKNAKDYEVYLKQEAVNRVWVILEYAQTVHFTFSV
jgi:hypothetical protein